MKSLIVGGNFYIGKESSTIKKLSLLFNNPCVYNGKLPKQIKNHDLVLWMPEIENEFPKKYPVKDIGSVLICSKVMREGYNHIDSVTRIFKMHGNAVIEIYKEKGMYLFELRDALNNCWCKKTKNLSILYESIITFYKWSKGSIRKSLKKQERFPITDKEINIDLYYKFIQLNRRLANKVAIGCNNRYFGNYSTRCTKLFPSVRENKNLFLFSPRDTNKKYVTVNARIVCDYDSYYGNLKPSVDTPVQLAIYSEFHDINYMIHGHAYIKGQPMTENYFPCGDMREVDGIRKLLLSGTKIINLKKHGFLIVAENIEKLEDYCTNYKFKAI